MALCGPIPFPFQISKNFTLEVYPHRWIRDVQDGDMLKQIDVDRGIYNETWRRCKPAASSLKQDGK